MLSCHLGFSKIHPFSLNDPKNQCKYWSNETKSYSRNPPNKWAIIFCISQQSKYSPRAAGHIVPYRKLALKLQRHEYCAKSTKLSEIALGAPMVRAFWSGVALATAASKAVRSRMSRRDITLQRNFCCLSR